MTMPTLNALGIPAVNQLYDCPRLVIKSARGRRRQKVNMSAELSKLMSPAAAQVAVDELVRLGRTAFLQRYGFGKSRDFLVRDPRSGELCDSKAIAGAAYGHQFPEKGPLHPADFSGGEATVVPKLQSLGFEVVRIGEDWSTEEVTATFASYFDMLRLDAQQASYKKSEFNAALRQRLRGAQQGIRRVEIPECQRCAARHGPAVHFRV